MRVIGLDYGSKTVGVALSDELMLTAQPLTTIHRDRPTKLRQTLAQIEQIIEQYDVDRIVVGWPKKLDNEEGEIFVTSLFLSFFSNFISKYFFKVKSNIVAENIFPNSDEENCDLIGFNILITSPGVASSSGISLKYLY